MALAPDVFAQGGDIQGRLAAILQDPAMRERLLGQMPQIVERLQGIGGPIGQRLAAEPNFIGGPGALQAEILRRGLGAPEGPAAPPFVPPGQAPGGGLPPDFGVTINDPGQPIPIDFDGIVQGPGAPPFFPGPDGGSSSFVPVEMGGGKPRAPFADLRRQYGNSDEMADRRMKQNREVQKNLDQGRQKRAQAPGLQTPPAPRPRQPSFVPDLSFSPEMNRETFDSLTPQQQQGPVWQSWLNGQGRSTRERMPQKPGGVARAQAPGLQTPRGSAGGFRVQSTGLKSRPKKRQKRQGGGSPPFKSSRGGAYGPAFMRFVK